MGESPEITCGGILIIGMVLTIIVLINKNEDAKREGKEQGRKEGYRKAYNKGKGILIKLMDAWVQKLEPIRSKLEEEDCIEYITLLQEIVEEMKAVRQKLDPSRVDPRYEDLEEPEDDFDFEQFTISELSVILGEDKEKIRKLIKEGTLKGKKQDNIWIVNEKTLDAYISEETADETEPDED